MSKYIRLGLLTSKKDSLPPFLPDAIPVSRAMYGQGIGYILYDEMDCTGLERNLSDCRSAGLLVNDCQHSEDAGVLCRREHFTPIKSQNNVCVCVQHTKFYYIDVLRFNNGYKWESESTKGS